jgi:Lipopolysaccharide-assembly
MKNALTIFILAAFCLLSLGFTGCKTFPYSFNERGGTLDPDIKTVRVQLIQNRAPYQNPQLSPNLTDRLRQKITRQTKLTQTNRDDANLDITGFITDYSVTTSGISSSNGQTQSSINRLTVTVHVIFNNAVKNDVKEADVSRSFDFPARQSLQQAEAGLLDEMIRNLSDEIFNRIFSDW